YNAFKKPVSISIEGRERIDFYYNPFKGRSAMFYGSDAEDITERPLQKYYAADGSMEIKSNTATGKTEFILYIGGDAYSSPVVLKSAGQTSAFLYLHRDYLGSILAITNQEGELLEKRHFSPWGNITQIQDGQGNDLESLTLLDRGYTGHEHLQGVELIHMNGRLYDPLLHRFLAPDNYVQDPYNTQNFNRYGYVLNNPLMYTDPSGEFWHIVIGAVVGGVVNLATNWNSIDNFWEGLSAFGVGAGAGALTAATGGAGAGFWATAGVASLGGAATMGTNNIIAQTGDGVGLSDVQWGRVGESALVGGISGFAGGAAGHWAANSSVLVNGINSPIARTLAVAPLASGAGHLAGGTASGVFKGQGFSMAFNNSFNGLGKSMLIGTGIGVASTVGVSYANGIN
ncbi:MAG: RHS repeat-associated core domain-containing protein, partial [Bacteroidota bacterium]